MVGSIITIINRTIHSDEIVNGAGLLRCLGPHICQHDQTFIKVDGIDKLNAFECPAVPGFRPSDVDAEIECIKVDSFDFKDCVCLVKSNCSFAFLHVAIIAYETVSSICKYHGASLSALRSQAAQNFCGIMFFTGRCRCKEEKLIVMLVFSDVGQTEENGKVIYTHGLLINCKKRGSVYHTISRSWHKSKRPV